MTVSRRGSGEHIDGSSRRLGWRLVSSRPFRNRSILSATLRRAVARAVGFKVIVRSKIPHFWQASIRPKNRFGMERMACFWSGSPWYAGAPGFFGMPLLLAGRSWAG
jgi:hypothetical protein